MWNFRALFSRQTPTASKPPVTVPPPRKPIKWATLVRQIAERLRGMAKPVIETQLAPYLPMPGVVPAKDYAEVKKLAMDAVPYQWLGTQPFGGVDNYFKGYPYLAQLSQLPEYRNIAQTIAEEMTRKGIKIIASDDVDKDNVAKMTELVKRYKVVEVCRAALELDAFFGRSHIYLDIETKGGRVFDDPVELQTELFLSNKKIQRNSLKGFTVIEAMWSYPGIYNSTNPLDDTFYKPDKWYVMGKSVHESRLLLVCSQPVPDLLKAAYSFGGLSLSQLAQPYVDNWLRTRNSVSDLIHSFSLTGVKTDLSALLSSPSGDPDPSNILNRITMLTQFRDNRSCLVLDKDTEEWFQINTPLSGLHELQAQSQEHICSVTHIPLVKYTGISPSGLNASSEGEIRVWYDFIKGRQERVLRPIIKRMIEVIQLSEWGKIDESLTFEFVSLFEPTPQEEEELRKSRAETDKTYVDSGVLSQQDVRTIIVNDPESRYANLDDELPEELEETDEAAQSQMVEASGRASGEA